jgi:hypothetical protein
MSPSASNNDSDLQVSDFFPSSHVLDRKATEELHILLEHRPDPRVRRSMMRIFRVLGELVRVIS